MPNNEYKSIPLPTFFPPKFDPEHLQSNGKLLTDAEISAAKQAIAQSEYAGRDNCLFSSEVMNDLLKKSGFSPIRYRILVTGGRYYAVYPGRGYKSSAVNNDSTPLKKKTLYLETRGDSLFYTALDPRGQTISGIISSDELMQIWGPLYSEYLDAVDKNPSKIEKLCLYSILEITHRRKHTTRDYVIGEGTYSKVIYVQDQEDKSLAALKVQECSEQDKLERVTREYAAMAAMGQVKDKSQVIVKIVVPSKKDEINPKLYLLMPLLPGGMLVEIVLWWGYNLAPMHRLHIALQALTLLIRFHDNGWLHRDITLRNLMFDPNTLSVFLIDFGLARQMHNGAVTADSYYCPKRYVCYPPEVQTDTESKPVTFDRKTEVYSFGELLNQLFGFRYKHFEGEPWIDNPNPCPPLTNNQNIKTIITKMKDVTPAKRLSFEEAKKDIAAVREKIKKDYPIAVAVLSRQDYEKYTEDEKIFLVSYLKKMDEVLLLDTHPEQEGERSRTEMVSFFKQHAIMLKNTMLIHQEDVASYLTEDAEKRDITINVITISHCDDRQYIFKLIMSHGYSIKDLNNLLGRIPRGSRQAFLESVDFDIIKTRPWSSGDVCDFLGFILVDTLKQVVHAGKSLLIRMLNEKMISPMLVLSLDNDFPLTECLDLVDDKVTFIKNVLERNIRPPSECLRNLESDQILPLLRITSLPHFQKNLTSWTDIIHFFQLIPKEQLSTAIDLSMDRKVLLVLFIKQIQSCQRSQGNNGIKQFLEQIDPDYLTAVIFDHKPNVNVVDKAVRMVQSQQDKTIQISLILAIAMAYKTRRASDKRAYTSRLGFISAWTGYSYPRALKLSAVSLLITEISDYLTGTPTTSDHSNRAMQNADLGKILACFNRLKEQYQAVDDTRHTPFFRPI